MNESTGSSPVPTSIRLRPLPGRPLALGLLVVALCPPFAAGAGQAPTDAFDGATVGLEVGALNYFGGAFVDGVDVLAQETKLVTDVFVGYRTQLLDDRLVLGARLSHGLTSGDLEHREPEDGLEIEYASDRQIGYSVEIGGVVGGRRNVLLFGYGGETRRRFDVKITQPHGSFSQTDEQTLGRFGLGVELALGRNLHLRASAGRVSVDFGDLVTNIDVEGRGDASIGVLLQF